LYNHGGVPSKGYGGGVVVTKDPTKSLMWSIYLTPYKFFLEIPEGFVILALWTKQK